MRAAYVARSANLATNLFVAPVLNQRIDKQAALLQAGLKDYDSQLAGEVMNQAGSLKSRINSRAQSLTGQLKGTRTGQDPPRQ